MSHPLNANHLPKFCTNHPLNRTWIPSNQSHLITQSSFPLLLLFGADDSALRETSPEYTNSSMDMVLSVEVVVGTG